MKQQETYHHGFTLVELMITIAIFGIVLTGVYSVYEAQVRSHYTQQQIMEMQQNIRAAFYLMEREIKMVGLNPTGNDDIGIDVADAHTLSFSMDFTGGSMDGDNEGANGIDDNGNGLVDEAVEAEWYDGHADPNANEEVVYILSNDADFNGINDGLPRRTDDGGSCNLLRNGYILALNIDALNFVYLDLNGAPLPTPVADPSAIRAIQVSLVARSGDKPSKYSYGYVDRRTIGTRDRRQVERKRSCSNRTIHSGGFQ